VRACMRHACHYAWACLCFHPMCSRRFSRFSGALILVSLSGTASRPSLSALEVLHLAKTGLRPSAAHKSFPHASNLAVPVRARPGAPASPSPLLLLLCRQHAIPTSRHGEEGLSFWSPARTEHIRMHGTHPHCTH